MSKGKIGAIVVSVVLVFYFVLMGQRAWILVREPDLVPRLMGIALFVLPLIGAWTLGVELMFGARSEKLARILESEGGLPVDDLPRTPGGRIIREAADEAFGQYKAEAEAAPEDWRSWFRLSCAYDACGDRKRARATMRKAISLYREGAKQKS
ncbi:MAG: tetratricopeptide repeat protein [Brevibacterium sp.]|uniref:tetratricopeptide repeat protein n=1 Tax=Brevibacterium sp. TaxID=1701 RepID=UPI002648EC6D|nr:tetratricopeptide repeat protein [Brevibacterium sp.]MDN5806445.1 tetratricopeptide repeat protein [Brevibacterium sp.]MDN5833438.1 tetratricopeptide repeat protein [Brevibacterium sp.]MDN5876526.1 tetratricopeptide repeat protein [Brevibacterium sp.]MDN5908618.1 tetratricopeptide repeat protein [Brevibacterium sp.]MDN6123503.1 tetratricopeptide repeat protein [Brevibacterium sp.]